ncbi:MAG: GNAT family N-acetyltransferase [Marinilabiliaceae bacterium]|nr:GNAT family N-acetyltransferase [Marinilabiliaceae bacterium]
MNLIELETHCDFLKLTSERPISNFDCGDSDLNDFFNRDAMLFQKQRLGQTFFHCLKDTDKIVCAFSLSADSLKTVLMPGSRIKKIKELIPREKALQSYPALLIGRLGVSVEFAGQGIGLQLLDAIKYYCDINFPYLVRFLVVDAYNNDAVLAYYQKGDFSFVFSTEQQEIENLRKKVNDNEMLNTRQMFFDMERWNK